MLTLEQKENSTLLIRSLKSRIWEFDLYLYFFLVFLFPASLSERSTTSSFTQFWHWTLVKFIQLIFSYFIFSTIKIFLHRSGRKYFYLYQIFIIGFVGGFASTFVIYLPLEYTNFIYTERNLFSFFTSNALMGAVWLPICCAASVSFRKFSEMNQLLSSTLSIKVINDIKHSQLFKSAVADQDRVTSNQIIKILKHSSNNKSMTEDLNIVGFSRRFKMFSFKDNVIKYFLIGIRSLDVYRHSIRYKPLNPLYFTFVITFIVAISVIKNDNSYRALIIVSYFAIYTYLFHALQVFFYKNVKNWIWLVILCDVLNIASLCVTGYLLHRYYDFFNDLNTSMITTYAVVVTLYLFLYFLGHISQSASIKYSQHKDNLEKYLNSDAFKLKVLNQELEKDALKWEQIIHGKLQSKVISKSLKEVNATDNQGLADENFLGEIIDLISNSLTGSPQKVANPTQTIELVSKPWSAVIDIQSDIDSSIANESLSPSVTQRVTDVLEEAITNAVKHGGAEQVWLVIKAGSNNSLQIQVKNDGAPVGKPKRASIGTNLFNQSGIWSIGNENGLVVFKIQIDI